MGHENRPCTRKKELRIKTLENNSFDTVTAELEDLIPKIPKLTIEQDPEPVTSSSYTHIDLSKIGLSAPLSFLPGGNFPRGFPAKILYSP